MPDENRSDETGAWAGTFPAETASRFEFVCPGCRLIIHASRRTETGRCRDCND